MLTSNKGFEEWGEIFGDEVMAAALIDRLVHHCHIVTIRGNSYRMRQHTELWHALHTAQDPEPAPKPPAVALVRRSRRTEARPLAELSDFQPAEVSDFGPALTCAPDRGGARSPRRSADDSGTVESERPTEQQIARLNCRGHAAGGGRRRSQTA